MNVATKLGLGYGVVVGLLALVMGGLVLSLERSAQRSRDLADASERLVLSATDQRVRLDDLQEAGLKYGITRDSGYARRFGELSSAFGSSLARYRRFAETAVEERAAEELAVAWEGFRTEWTPIEARLSPERSESEADSAFVAAVDRLRGANRELTDATRASILSSVDAAVDRARASERYAWWGVALATLLAGVVWLLIVRSMGRALRRLVAGTRRVADGVVWIGDDVTESILRELRADDLVCVGATRSTALTQALFGSIPEEIASRVDGTMAIVRGREYRPRSLVDALVERLRS